MNTLATFGIIAGLTLAFEVGYALLDKVVMTQMHKGEWSCVYWAVASVLIFCFSVELNRLPHPVEMFLFYSMVYLHVMVSWDRKGPPKLRRTWPPPHVTNAKKRPGIR